eukprot:Phypoly_transcript_02754.p1 GENE.Phypoly_transcript_02754~~Phypoly_transcript_02754.p1  ORF type:complete len:735 (+),score=151.44 Phypoly_transcript_02754:216-2207(+)
MNDIIRSLRVVDLEGGKIANISYESQSEPDSVPPLPSQLNTSIYQFLVGSNVSVKQIDSDKVISGRVLGTNQTHIGADYQEKIQILVDNARIHFISTVNIASIDIIDSHVQGNVKENLDSILNAKKKDIRQVNINCKGSGTRTVRVSYILENPIWKSNYRIYMKNAAEGKEKQFFMEGWACVDNISEYDWNEVSLALVSGSPISFQHEIYNPIIGIRPSSFSDEGKTAQNVTLMQANNNRPSPAGAPQRHIMLQNLQQQMQQQQAQMQMQQMQPQMHSSPYMPPTMSGMAQGMDIDSQTVEIGNLFHYEINTPITVKKDHSSLVPTVSGAFKARQVCWFDPKRHAVNPMESIMLKNTLGTILDKGPVIITEDENYLGESIFENTLMLDENKLLSYSVNLECKVSKTSSSFQKPKKTVVRNGVVYVSNSLHRNTAYTLMNNSEHEIELILDHEEYVEEKIEGAKNQAKFKTGTRFYVMLPPLKKTIFDIPIVSTSTAIEKKIGAFSEIEIARLFTSRYLTKQVYDTLKALYSDALKVYKINTGLLDELAAEQRIIDDQKRILSLINPRAGQATGFEKQLSDLETNLAESRKRYTEKVHVWKEERKAVEKRVQDLRIEINLETEQIPQEQVSEVDAQLQGFHTSSLDSLLAGRHEDGSQAKKRKT